MNLYNCKVSTFYVKWYNMNSEKIVTSYGYILKFVKQSLKIMQKDKTKTANREIKMEFF